MYSRVRVPIKVSAIYRKVLIPLDGSEDAENILPLIKDHIAPCREAVLLHVIPTPTFPGWLMGQHHIGGQPLEARRARAMDYLSRVALGLGWHSTRWRCEVAISKAVPQGILDFAIRERVDLIVMYAHDRRGFARLVKKSIIKYVQLRAPMEVKVFTPRQLSMDRPPALATGLRSI